MESGNHNIGGETNTNNNRWIKVNKVGEEREISLFVVVEVLRFIFYLWFVVIIITGVTLTIGFVDEEFKTTITSVFGSLNVCAFFDFPPSTYILPTLYAIQLVVIYQYSIVSVFRAWIAKEEKKISGASLCLYVGAFIYFAFSAAVFSTIFAIQPDPKHPVTVLIHTIPFTNLIISLTVLQIAVTWFGVKVSWGGLNAPICSVRTFAYICLVGLIVTSMGKVIHHINALGDLGTGLWWRVDEEALRPIFQVLDACWLVSGIVGPMCQSGYLAWRKFDTHGVVITIGDNRKSNITNIADESNVENKEEEQESFL